MVGEPGRAGASTQALKNITWQKSSSILHTESDGRGTQTPQTDSPMDLTGLLSLKSAWLRTSFFWGERNILFNISCGKQHGVVTLHKTAVWRPHVVQILFFIKEDKHFCLTSWRVLQQLNSKLWSAWPNTMTLCYSWWFQNLFIISDFLRKVRDHKYFISFLLFF